MPRISACSQSDTPRSTQHLSVLIDDRPDAVDCEPGRTPIMRWRNGPAHVSAYRAVIASSSQRAARGQGDVWDSVWQVGDGFKGIRLTGFPREPSRRVWVSLNVRDGSGKESGWSTPITAGTGAGKKWIASPIWADPSCGWVFIRGQARIRPDILARIRWATLNVASSSPSPSRQYVAHIWCNGQLIGFNPTFSLGREARSDVFDITGLVRSRKSLTIAALAYSGSTKDGEEDGREEDGRKFCAQVDIGLDDGSVMHWGTGGAWDAQWRVLPADEICGSSISEGTQYFTVPAEHIRTSRYPCGFAQPGFMCDPAAGWQRPTDRPQFHAYASSPTRHVVGRSVPVRVIGTPSAHRVIFDAGGAWLGGAVVKWRLNSPLHVIVRYGEVLDDHAPTPALSGSKKPVTDVKYHLSAGNTYEDRWDLCPGNHQLAGWGLHVFRYISVTCEDPTVSVRGLIEEGKLSLSAQAVVYPMDSQATFHCSSRDLTRIWNVSAHTIRALTGSIYTDSWTRERCPYEADAWIQQRAHLQIADEPELGQYSARYLLEHRTWPTEWPLYLVMMIVEGWIDSGNDRLLRDAYPRFIDLLPERFVDSSTGLILKDPGHSSELNGDLVDWPASERDGFVFTPVNAVINALAAQAYRDAARAAEYLGYARDASHDTHRAQAISDAFNRLLYVPSLGAYADGLMIRPGSTSPDSRFVRVTHCSLHASAFALGCGLVPPDRVQPVLAFLRSRGMACSVYAAQTYLDGLFRAGDGPDAVRLLTSHGMRSWMNMLDTGAGALMEAWDVRIKPNTTYSHPWACSPLQLCGQGILGVRPLEPGYRRFVVCPQLGGLRWASGVIPVRTGDIRVSVEQKSDSIVHIDVNVPPRTNAEICVDGSSHRIVCSPGIHHVDCQRVSVSDEQDSKLRSVKCEGRKKP